jgi:hypothetical protein
MFKPTLLAAGVALAMTAMSVGATEVYEGTPTTYSSETDLVLGSSESDAGINVVVSDKSLTVTAPNITVTGSDAIRNGTGNGVVPVDGIGLKVGDESTESISLNSPKTGSNTGMFTVKNKTYLTAKKSLLMRSTAFGLKTILKARPFQSLIRPFMSTPTPLR